MKERPALLPRAVHGRGVWDASENPVGSTGLVPADVNDAWYAPGPVTVRSLRDAVAFANYSPEIDGRSIKASLSEYSGVSSDRLLIGAGSTDLLWTMLGAATSNSTVLAQLAPTYAEYAVIGQAKGAEIRSVSVTQEGDGAAELERLLALCAACDPGVLVIANPNNPTGKTLQKGTLREIVAGVEKWQVLVDEAYIDYMPAESVIAMVDELPNLAVVRTFSKAFALAGVRVAYAALGDIWCHLLDGAQRPWPVSVAAQFGVPAAISELDYFQARVQQHLALAQDLRDRLWLEARLPCLESDCPFFLVRLDPPWPNATRLAALLSDLGILVKSGALYPGSLGEKWLRITARGSAENTKIIQAFVGVRAALDEGG